jgi:hypothetical protein
MTTRSLLLAVTLATSSAAFGQTLERPTTAATRETPAREQTLLVELVNGMRELIEAVVPEISLPAIELKLPTLDIDRR